MRLRLLAGLLGLGLGLGALFGLSVPDSSTAVPVDPLADEYVRLVSELYAKGESLSLAEARLRAVSPDGDFSFVARVAARSGSTVELATKDLPAVLVALAPQPEPTVSLPPRLAASGRGSGPSPTPRPEVAAGQRAVDFPLSGRVSATKGDASLRTKPALNGAVLRIIPRGSEIVLLGVEQGQAVEGAEVDGIA